MPFRFRLLATLGAAGLLWVGFLPGWGWVAWCAAIPFLWALDGQRGRRGLALGALFGVTFFALEFSSLVSLWPFVGPMVYLVCTALALLGGPFFAAFGLVAGRWSHPFVWVGAWVLMEALRAAGPLGFTFGSLPAAMAGGPFVPAAATGGPWLLSLGMVWTTSCVARGVRDRRWWWAAPLGPVILFAMAQVPAGTPEVGSVTVALVQPNIAKIDQLDPRNLPVQVQVYQDLLGAVPSGVELVVAPENALPWLLEEPPYMKLFEDTAQRTGARVVVGTGVFEEGEVFNTILVLSPTGEVEGSYAKTRLVPFGERVPWRDFWTRIGLASLIDPYLPFDQSPGEAIRPVGPLGILVCFESTFPGVARELVRQGAQVLITPTNDAWFGRTRILWEHYAWGSLRAAETGRSFVQVGQTGISGVWDRRGRELDRLPPWTQGIGIFDVPLHTGLTPYVRAGDGPVLGLAGLLLIVGVTTQRPRPGRGRGGQLRTTRGRM